MRRYIHFVLTMISLILATLSAYALVCVGTERLLDFLLLLAVSLDAICFPWAFCHHVDLHTRGEMSFPDKFPFHSGYVLFFFLSPYFAFLYFKSWLKK